MAPVGLYLEIVLKFKKQTNKTKTVYSNMWICQRTISLSVYFCLSSSLFALGLSIFF